MVPEQIIPEYMASENKNVIPALALELGKLLVRL